MATDAQGLKGNHWRGAGHTALGLTDWRFCLWSRISLWAEQNLRMVSPGEGEVQGLVLEMHLVSPRRPVLNAWEI